MVQNTQREKEEKQKKRQYTGRKYLQIISLNKVLTSKI